jgi:two-component system nitrate/nitrite response regulator NarL
MLGSVGSTFVVALIGSRVLLREGLARILSAADFNIVTAASSVDDIAANTLPRDQSILLVLDVGDGELSTIRQIRTFKEQYPTARIALLGEHDRLSESHIIAAFEAGAHAYFVEPTSATFIKSLELVMLGEVIVPPAVMSLLGQRYNEVTVSRSATAEVSREVDSEYTPRLSAREICILRRLIAGDSNKMIARNNAIAEATVKVHVKAILRKIGVSNRTQAAIWGMLNDRLVEGMSRALVSSAGMATEPSLRQNGSNGSRIAAAPGPSSIHHQRRTNGADHGDPPDEGTVVGTGC